jgi:proteasome alpha subunit
MKNELLPAQQGYDRAITVFSPDGRLYQVEYAIETVRRGTIAVGIKTKKGIIIAVEEKPRKLQISETAQKIFQVDDHIGIAAAGYIPDARSQVDNARFFSQSNKLIYAEPVDVETVAKHLADQCQQFTQYAGVRPMGVALIIGGIDNNGASQIFLTDPSGTYISYDAVAIGSGSDQVTEFLEQNYKTDLSLEDASILAAASIYLGSEDKEGIHHIRMAQIKSDTKQFEIIPEKQIENFAKLAKTKYPPTTN